MSANDNLQWDEVDDAAKKMFDVWLIGSELDWAKEACSHLAAAGLLNALTLLDLTAAKLRLVTLALIYQEFCGFAWDENPETPVGYLAEDLDIDPVALGILAGRVESDEFEDSTDEYELRQAALWAVTDSQRHNIFECLRAAYGDELKLYSRIWHTRSPLDSDGDEWEVTDRNSAALEFVSNGFRS